MKLVMVETTHHDCMKQMLYLEVRDPRVPSSYDKAILIPMWKTAICVELKKFKKHNCLLLMHFDGQYLVPMKWIFSIKTDGTCKARLVGPGPHDTPGRLQSKGSLMWKHLRLRD